MSPLPPAAAAVVVVEAEVGGTGSGGAGGAPVPNVEELAAAADGEEDYRNPFAGTEPQSRRPPSIKITLLLSCFFRSLFSHTHFFLLILLPIAFLFTCLLHFLTYFQSDHRSFSTSSALLFLRPSNTPNYRE